MPLIGREREKEQLLELSRSDAPEIVVVYGRRRVGKTYFVNQTFHSDFDFSCAGLSPAELDQIKEKKKSKTGLQLQLDHFFYSLKEYGYKGNEAPNTWLEAFHFLSLLLQEKKTRKKQIVFLDELPWFDTSKSFFVTAFESFCNGYASRSNAMLIIAGSAISWFMKELFHNHGGLYGRATCEIPLCPFTLSETERALENRGVFYSRYEIVRSYMVFGGIPYYLNYLDGRYSLNENIDRLFFAPYAPLSLEFSSLFNASFEKGRIAEAIARALSEKGIGLTRDELSKASGYSDGQAFSEAIRSMTASGFILSYTPLQDEEKRLRYKLIDPFCLFYLRFVDGRQSLDPHFFSDSADSGTLVAWKGFAFENVCYNHLERIKDALGIRSVATSRFSFIARSDGSERGAQVDLVLERKDNIVNLCEMKFLTIPYSPTTKDEANLKNKKTVLAKFLRKTHSIQTVLISSYGISKSKYQWMYQRILTLDDLFRF